MKKGDRTAINCWSPSFYIALAQLLLSGMEGGGSSIQIGSLHFAP
ncbi:hypothetical protein [Brevibacillus sp. NRS-1366]